MPYVLGVDVGNSRTAAATCRLGDPLLGDPDTVPLGTHTDSMASAVYLAPDGTVVVGDAARQQAPSEPGSVAREFLGRMGDDIPLLIGGEPCTPQDLVAAMVMWVVEQTAGIHGAPAEHIVVTHPAGWGSYRRMLLHQALRRAGLSTITLLPEPIAAGERHAARAEVVSGDRLAVYHLDADTFSASVIRRTDAGTFELLGNTDSTEPVGGTYFDDTLLDHVRGKLGAAARSLDPFDVQARFAMARLRRECAEARRRLTVEPQATIQAQLPGGRATVVVTRGEFESLIRPALETTVDTLRRTVRRAPGDRLDAVLLAGEESAIPLVSELVSTEVRCQVVPAATPGHALAGGAALAARRLVSNDVDTGAPRVAAPGTTLEPPGSTELTSVVADLDLDDDEEEDEPPPRPSIDITPPELPVSRSPMRRFTGAKSASAGVLAALAGVLALAPAAHRDSAVPEPARSAIPMMINNAPTGAVPAILIADHEQDKDGH